MPAWRPTTYDFELCKKICEHVSNGDSVSKALEKEDWPAYSTWCLWKRDHEELSELYTRAREDKADKVDEKIDEIMEWIKNGTFDASIGRVLIDTLKWKAAKYYPRMFGEKVDMTSGGEKLSTYIITTNLNDKGSES